MIAAKMYVFLQLQVLWFNLKTYPRQIDLHSFALYYGLFIHNRYVSHGIVLLFYNNSYIMKYSYKLH